jgi:hypothetical protein
MVIELPHIVGNIENGLMLEYLQYGLTGLAAVMALFGMVQLTSHQVDPLGRMLDIPDAEAQAMLVARLNVFMLRSVGDQIIGAVILAGSFVSICILWFG